MTNWQEIFASIPIGTNEADLEDRLMLSFLSDLGFNNTQYTKDKKFGRAGSSIRPDFTCSFDSLENPLLVIECKAVRQELIKDAVSEVQEQMVIAQSKFGLAINGLQYQLWQRHGQICVPRTRLNYLNTNNIESVISEIKIHLEIPRRALTVMLWNNKGGVGKTTATANIATILAMKHNAKILVINFDFQGDLNVIMGFTPMSAYTPSPNILNVLEDANVGLGKYSLKSLIRTLTFEKGRILQKKEKVSLDIIPGDKSMQLFERGQESEKGHGGGKVENASLLVPTHIPLVNCQKNN